MNFPTILTTSVCRSSRQNQPHGSAYLVNLNNGKFKNIIEADNDIDYHGRGGERGFRGIAFWKNKIYIGIHNGIHICNKHFKYITTIFADGFLGNVHEIYIFNNVLYVVSTMHDGIAAIDLTTNKITNYYVVKQKTKGIYTVGTKNKNNPPNKVDSLHINNVFVDDRGIFISGTNFSYLLLIKNDKVIKFAPILPGTHNAQPFENNILCNDTRHNRVCLLSNTGSIIKHGNVPKIPKNKMINTDVKDTIARQPFARGLTFYKDYIIAGSSPAMISIYDKNTMQNIKNITLSMSIKHCIHGLEIFPYKQNLI